MDYRRSPRRRTMSAAKRPYSATRDGTLPIVWLVAILGSAFTYFGSRYSTTIASNAKHWTTTCSNVTRGIVLVHHGSWFSMSSSPSGLLSWEDLSFLAFIESLFFLWRNFPNKVGSLDFALRNLLWSFQRWRVDFQAVKQYKDIHPKYGPIVHKVNSPYLKDMNFYGCFKATESLLGINDSKYHRQRRDLLNVIFAKSTILKRSAYVQERGQMLSNRISRMIKESGKETIMLDMYQAEYCFQYDVISEIVFTGNKDFVGTNPTLTDPKFDSVNSALEGMTLMRYFPLALHILEEIPDFIMDRIAPGSAGHKGMRKEILGEVAAARRMAESGELKSQNKMPSVITELVTELDDNKVAQESHIMFGAGMHTTNHTFNGGLYFLCADKEVQRRLHEEVKSVWPDLAVQPDYSAIEALPYLTAFIKEVLRLSFAQPGPMPRIAPAGAKLLGRDIPAGTVIETDCYHIQMNPDLFPNPYTFSPDRWRTESARAKNLDKYLTLFSSGSRMCVGLHIAYMSLYVTFAYLVRRFEIDITDKMRAEGYVWTNKWSGVKRGEPFKFYFKERGD